MAEWSIAAALKAVVGASPPWVRILPPPPKFLLFFLADCVIVKYKYRKGGINMARISTKTVASVTSCSKNTKDLIAKKAYELYVKSGYKPGHDLDNWVKAEKIIKSGCCK